MCEFIWFTILIYDVNYDVIMQNFFTQERKMVKPWDL